MRKIAVAIVVLTAFCLVQADTDAPASKPAEGAAPVVKLVERAKPVASSAPAPEPIKPAPPPIKPAEGPTLRAAEKLYRTGKYDQAVKAYRKLLNSPADALAAAIALAETYEMTGKYDQALAALDGAAEPGKLSADWHVARSEALALVGKYKQSLAAATRAFELRPIWAPAILRLGTAQETIGEKTEAIATYKNIEKTIDKGKYRKQARDLVAAGMVLDRYGVLIGEKASVQAQNVLHNYFQRAYQKVDKTYWPAHVAAGELLIAKHQSKLAGQEFKLAGKVNKRLPIVHAAAAMMYLQKYGFEKAIARANKGLKINPRQSPRLFSPDPLDNLFKNRVPVSEFFTARNRS